MSRAHGNDAKTVILRHRVSQRWIQFSNSSRHSQTHLRALATRSARGVHEASAQGGRGNRNLFRKIRNKTRHACRQTARRANHLSRSCCQSVGWVERFAKPITATKCNGWVSRSLSSGAHSRDPLAPPILLADPDHRRIPQYLSNRSALPLPLWESVGGEGCSVPANHHLSPGLHRYSTIPLALALWLLNSLPGLGGHQTCEFWESWR